MFFYDIFRGITRRFDDNSLFRATFSCLRDNIIAISRNTKVNKYKIVVLDVKAVKDEELMASIEIGSEIFPDFGNFYVCNVFQVEPNLTLIAGVDLEPGKKQMDLKSPQIVYLIKGELLSNHLLIKKMKLFSADGYSDLYLESGMYLPSYEFLYLENR